MYLMDLKAEYASDVNMDNGKEAKYPDNLSS